MSEAANKTNGGERQRALDRVSKQFEQHAQTTFGYLQLQHILRMARAELLFEHFNRSHFSSILNAGLISSFEFKLKVFVDVLHRKVCVQGRTVRQSVWGGGTIEA